MYSRPAHAPDSPGAPARPARSPCGRHFCDDLARPQLRGIDIGNRVFRNPLLLVARVKDCRTIASAYVVALAVARRRVVDLEEELEQGPVADLLRIKGDLDGFCVRAVIAVGGEVWR